MKPNVILGKFPFALDNAMYQQLQRSTTHRISSHERVGKPPVYQNLGEGDDDLNLSGTIMPMFTGIESSKALEKLRVMMKAGKAYTLILIDSIDNQGDIRGNWFIVGVDETQSELFGASPQKTEFQLKLKRDYGD